MTSSLDLKTLEAAATWYVQLNDGTVNEARTQAWQAWITSDPLHSQAWERVETLQRQWALMPRQAALSSLDAAKTQRRDVLKLLGMLVAAGGCTWMAADQIPYRSMLAQQRTGTRERRTLQLDDGSQLELNAGTALYAAGVTSSITDGLAKAREAIASGAARAKLEQFVQVTQALGKA